MLILTVLAIWLLLVRAPDTPVARLFRYCLVDRPAYWINRIRRGDVLLGVIVIILVALATVALDSEGLHILALAAPETTGWILMFDISTYLDIVVTLAVASSLVRLQAVRGYISARFPARRARPVRRARRAVRRRSTPQSPAANDDSDGHGLRLVA